LSQILYLNIAKLSTNLFALRIAYRVLREEKEPEKKEDKKIIKLKGEQFIEI